MAKRAMKLGGLLPVQGSKRTLAPQLVEWFGSHSSYYEPFCASCAVLLAKPVARQETVCDLYGEIINVIRVVQHRRDDLKSLLDPVLFHEEYLEETAKRWAAVDHRPAADLPDVQRAADFLVVSWFGRNGTVGTRKYRPSFCVRFSDTGGNPAIRWQSVKDSLDAWSKRLQGVVVLNRCAFEVLGQIHDTSGTVIYCDPPYMTKAQAYKHDFTIEQHKRLAATLNRFSEARIFVSYYSDPLIDSLYTGWERRSVIVHKNMSNQDGSSGVKAEEIVWVKRG